MANRHLARTIVIQSLFEWDFMDKSKQDLDEILRHNVEEFIPNADDDSLAFIRELATGVAEKQAKLDTIIERAAPEWPIDRIAHVDRAVLRLGLYELLFGNHKEVPPKVAINEAIELAKTFGGGQSGRFVNGVLGAVYKELGEPGKSDTSNKKKKKVDPKTLPIDKLIGALVYAHHEGEVYIALIHDVFGHWTMTKGHLQEGESEEDGVIRKAKEEMGAHVTAVKETIGKNEYVASHPEKGKIRKQVSYFLAEADFQGLTAGESGGIDDARWFKLSEVTSLNIYEDMMPVVTKGINILLNKPN